MNRKNTHPILIEEKSPANEFDDEQRTEREKRRRLHFPRRRGLLVVAVVLVLCVPSGIFLFTHVAQNRSPAAKTTSINWCVASGGQVPGNIISLNHLMALAPNNIWATGQFRNGAAVEPLLEHWNGSSWSVVPTADTTALRSRLESLAGDGSGLQPLLSLNAMVGNSANDIWAVGAISVLPSSGTPGLGVSQPLIEHWNGSNWQVVPSPDVASQGLEELTDIVAPSANDIWAVGSRQVAGSNSSTTLIEHWNGNGWQTVQLPASLQTGSFSHIRAFGPKNVWAFGVSSPPSPASGTLLIGHWDGQQWSKQAFPGTISVSSLNAITALTPKNFWIAARGPVTSQGALTTLPLLLHWDGQQWSQAAEANGLVVGADLSGLAASGQNDIWAAGTNNQNTDSGSPLLLHWDGQNWNIARQESSVLGTFSDVAVTGGTVWVIGTTFAEAASFSMSNATLIEHSC